MLSPDKPRRQRPVTQNLDAPDAPWLTQSSSAQGFEQDWQEWPEGFKKDFPKDDIEIRLNFDSALLGGAGPSGASMSSVPELVPPTPEESVSFATSGKSGGKEGRLF